MVGSRRRLLSQGSDYGNGYSNGNGGDIDRNQRADLESGYGTIKKVAPKQRFRDAIHQSLHTQRAGEMKKKLIDNVDHDVLEKFRKSETSV